MKLYIWYDLNFVKLYTWLKDWKKLGKMLIVVFLYEVAIFFFIFYYIFIPFSQGAHSTFKIREGGAETLKE